MELPELGTLVKFAVLAKENGVRPSRLHQARTAGIKSVCGDTIRLNAWKTLGGWATTRAEMRKFTQRLNL